MLPEFNLFETVPIQLQVDKHYYQDYTPIATIGEKQPIVIVANGAPRQCWDLKKSYFYVRAKIVGADGADVADATNVSVVNNTIHSMFQQIDVELNDKQVSDNNTLYGYRAYIENSLSFSKDVHESWLRAELFIKDTAGSWASFTREDAGTNAGLKARGTIFNGSAEVEMMGRPHTDLFLQDKAIIPSCKLTMRFIPARDNFVLMTPAPGGGGVQVAYKLKIMDLRLYLHVLEISNSLGVAIEKMMEKVNARYILNKNAMKIVTIPAGQTTIMQDNVYLGRLPKRITLGFVADAAMAGGYQQNPFNFAHFNLSQLVLNVNGEMVPSRPFTPDFTNQRYIREFQSLYDGLRILFSEKTLDITFSEFAQGFLFFVFDLTPHHHSACQSQIANGNIRIEVKFANALAATVNMLLAAEYDALMEIDSKRNVITPY